MTATAKMADALSHAQPRCVNSSVERLCAGAWKKEACTWSIHLLAASTPDDSPRRTSVEGIIATGDMFCRVLSKALATEWADSALRPFEFALQARDGTSWN